MNFLLAAMGWIQTWSGLPEVVALAAAATIAYLFGRHSRSVPADPVEEQAQRELKRASAIAKDLENIAATVRKDLAAHHNSIVQFRARLASMHHSEERATCTALYQEAEQILAPTLKLAAQLSHAYDQIRQQSTQLLAFTEVRCDPLTGISNRRALDEQIKLMFAMMTRYDRPFSIVIFDIDDFKKINDREGRLYGDRALQEVANLLKHYVRETDFVARYGGEEFVVVMPQTRLAGASVFGERLRRLVEQHLDLSVSGGVAEAASQDTLQTLLSRADSALYSAKAAGRNLVYQHTGVAIRRVDKQNPERGRSPDSRASESTVVIRRQKESTAQPTSHECEAVCEPAEAAS